MVLYAFIKGVFREAFAKRILITIFGFFSVLIILFVFAITNSTVEGLQLMLESGSAGGLKEAVLTFESYIVSGIPMFMLVASMLIITSSFVPDMLKKGHIDLLLSKPISRTKIVFGHFFAATLLVLFSFTFLLGSIWILISAKNRILEFIIPLFNILVYSDIFHIILVSNVDWSFVEKYCTNDYDKYVTVFSDYILIVSRKHIFSERPKRNSVWTCC